MKIRLLEIAQIELDQAIEYYSYESPGLEDAKCGGFPMESFTRFGKMRF
jgi:hypothetical protein